MTRKRAVLRNAAAVLVLAALSGCSTGFLPFGKSPSAQSAPADATRPRARPQAVAPPAGARTAESFDATTPQERKAATAPSDASAPERELGRTVASLGDPGDPGLWARTPLVTTVRRGRLVYPANGKSVLVELRPLDAAPGSGSQVSLSALRLLGAPLTALPELIVFAR